MTLDVSAAGKQGSDSAVRFEPDMLVVADLDVLDPRNRGHISRFKDNSWCIHSPAIKPTAHVTVNFEDVPCQYRDSLKRLVYIERNLETPLSAIEHSENKMQTEIAAGTVKANYYMGWRPFVHWLAERNVACFADADYTTLHDYYDQVATLDRTTDEKGLRLWSLTRLWLDAPYLPVDDQLAQPFWEAADAEERISDLVGSEKPRGANRTRPIHPETMSALIACCLYVLNDCSEAILRAKAQRDELAGRARTRRRPGDRERWDEYLDSLRQSGGSLPGHLRGDEVVLARVYIAATVDVAISLVDKAELRRDIPIRLGAPLDIEMAGGTKDRPQVDSMDYYEVDRWVRPLTAACFIVIAYLSGMRAEEVRGLERGSCSRSDPHDEISGYEIRSKVLKVKGVDGNTIPGGIERHYPWVVIDPVARAVEIRERLHPQHELLFSAAALVFHKGTSTDLSATTVTINRHIQGLIEWWNDNAPEMGQPGIPPEPPSADGRTRRITVSRFRRTIAWFVYRLPFGLIALGIQYGHIDLRQSAAYAARTENDMSEVLEELALAQIDTLATAEAGYEAGEGVSGPAGDRYIGGVAEYSTKFGGRVLDKRDFEDLLRNPKLRMYNNENQFLTCCYDATRAFCHPDNDRAPSIERSPDLTRCDPRCPNAACTDTNIVAVEAEIGRLDAEIASPIVPEPIRERALQRRAKLMTIVEEHERTRIVGGEET